ncbi:MAG TPA: hypothetical protein VF535_11285 [Allosphingosinicella sp.]
MGDRPQPVDGDLGSDSRVAVPYQSIAFLTWRGAGLVKAFGVVFAIHALQNGLATFILLWAE